MERRIFVEMFYDSVTEVRWFNAERNIAEFSKLGFVATFFLFPINNLFLLIYYLNTRTQWQLLSNRQSLKKNILFIVGTACAVNCCTQFTYRLLLAILLRNYHFWVNTPELITISWFTYEMVVSVDVLTTTV